VFSLHSSFRGTQQTTGPVRVDCDKRADDAGLICFDCELLFIKNRTEKKERRAFQLRYGSAALKE
jgi:hypothetical protein